MKLFTTAACGHYVQTRAVTGSRTSVERALAVAAKRPCGNCPVENKEWWDFDSWAETCDCHGCDCCCCSICCTGYCRRNEGIDPQYVRLYAEAGIVVPHSCYPTRWAEVGWECMACGIWNWSH